MTRWARDCAPIPNILSQYHSTSAHLRAYIFAHREARNPDLSQKRRVKFVLGEQLGVTKGKRLVRRVLSTDPPTAEVSFEDSGTICGVAVTGMGTYTSVINADGSLHGEGQGMEMTADGEAATWKGTGVGKFGPGGSVSYRGMLFFRTASQKLARLNNACVAFEYDVDAAGATVSKMWEWK